MAAYASAALAGGLIASLTLMGASRKVFGPATVERYLVPHRADIGIATFLNIGVAASVQLGALGVAFGVGGEMHLVPAGLAQLGYLASLISRGDLPPAHPHRLVLLVLVWVGLAVSSAWAQVLFEVTSLWIVKLRLNPGPPAKAKKAADAVELGLAPAAAPFIKPKRGSKSPGKGKPKPAGAHKKKK